MHETYKREGEKKFCYFVKDYVSVIFIKQKRLLLDGAWEEEEKGIECPRAAKCRKAEHNCLAIHPESGTDPFIPFTNLLRDMW